MGSPFTILNPTPLTKLHSRTETALHGKLDTWLHPVAVTDIKFTFSVEPLILRYPSILPYSDDWSLLDRSLLTTVKPTTEGDTDECSENDTLDLSDGYCLTTAMRSRPMWYLWIQVAIDGRVMSFGIPWPDYIVAQDIRTPPRLSAHPTRLPPGWRPVVGTLPPYIYSNGHPVSGPIDPTPPGPFGLRFEVDYDASTVTLQMRSYQDEVVQIMATSAFTGGLETPLVPYDIAFFKHVDQNYITFDDQPGYTWTHTEVGEDHLDGNTFTHRKVATPYYDPLKCGPLDFHNGRTCKRGYTPTTLTRVAGRAILAGAAVRSKTDGFYHDSDYLPPGDFWETHSEAEGWGIRDSNLALAYPYYLGLNPTQSGPWGHFERYSGAYGDRIGDKYAHFEQVYDQLEQLFLDNLTLVSPQRLRCEVDYDYREYDPGGEFNHVVREWELAIPTKITHKRFETHGMRPEWSNVDDEIVSKPTFPPVDRTWYTHTTKEAEQLCKSTELSIFMEPSALRLTAQITPFSFTVDTNGEEV